MDFQTTFERPPFLRSNKTTSTPLKIDFLSSNFKRYFTSDHFCRDLGVLKSPNWPCSGENNARFVDFIHNAENKVKQIIYAWRIIPHNKTVPN